MEDAHRWNTTYTNHVKQKRKIYHDGFLVLQPSRHKVMLYDESEKLLETRFVKKDDVIKSGETLTFDSYLVDIGELCGGHQSTSNFNCQEKDRKITEKSGSSYNNNFQNRRPMFEKSKARVNNLSPSHKMIRDFKKSEINKSGSSPNCVDTTNVYTKEWPVLYTTQITQKAKKFHDGFLELIVRGLQGRQVKLYDTNRRHLDSRFLKKDEIVCSGESLAFEGHLVEIEEQEEDNKPLTETPQGKNCKVIGKTSLADRLAKITTNKKFPAGKPPDNISQEKLTNLNDSSSKIQNAKLSWGNAEPRRAVHDILSILKQPSERKVDPRIKPFTYDLLESHSSDSQSNTERHYAEEGSRTEELREKTSDYNSQVKFLKPAAFEVIIAAGGCTVSAQATSSSFCLRSERRNSIGPTTNVECSNISELMSNSSSVESHMTLNFVDQTPIKSATLTRSIKIEKPENPTKMCPREDIMTETNAAAKNDLSTSELPKEELNGSKSGCHEAASHVSTVASNDCTSHDISGVEDNTPKKEIHTTEHDEFPSFDLGF
ncbi:hypothetical protein ACS0TY_011130 [Phlomoides rotata]